MTGRGLFLVVLVTVGLLVCAQSFAAAVETNWGKWGPDDQVGTQNYITPEIIRHAVSLVKRGDIYHLALPVEPEQPSGSSRTGRVYRYMTSTGQAAGGAPATAEDHLFTPVHGTTHWDGLAHVYGEAKLYNGYDARTYATPAGALKNGVHNVANKMVTRGVLVDIARYKGVKRLAGDHLITPEDIEKAARMENVSFRRGDVVLIRTGWLSVWYEQGKTAFYRSGSPGIGWEVSQWLKRIQAVAVGVDTLNVEFMPCEPKAAQLVGQPDWSMPIHYELIRNQGMMILDLAYLDELAEACARDGVYEFLFVGEPLNLTNATGSPASPLAVK